MRGNEATFTMQKTLDGFLSDSDLEQDYKECLEIVKKAGHFDFVETCAKIFFTEEKNPKKRLVWLYGPRNCGKSTFVGLMEEIFSTETFNFKQAYCVMDQDKKGKNWATQLYTSHEFDVKSAFVGEHFAVMKELFEGKGAKVSTNKFAPYSREMVNGFFLIASNELPMCT